MFLFGSVHRGTFAFFRLGWWCGWVELVGWLRGRVDGRRGGGGLLALAWFADGESRI